MPTIDNLLKNETAKGVAIGLGAALVGVAAIPAVIMVGRPLARVAIKSGLLFLEKGREAMAEATESLEDLVAEVKAELVSSHNEAPFSAEPSDLSEPQDS
ncbi:MAG TPA: DUF5132 domain-containing protein [Methylococcaceae bacterium]|jgi:hypothetical protein|nr:DUF5132 domain-containing protein [Methylococcaceae bacterium]